MGHFVNIDQTRIAAYFKNTNGTETWNTDSTSSSYCTQVTVGKRYALAFSETDRTVVGGLFRFGFSNTTTPTGQVLSRPMRGTPQTVSFAPFVPDKPYLIIQLGYGSEARALANLSLYEFSDSETEESMGSLMLRRPSIATLDGWDEVWTYEDGIPNIHGWTLSTSGTQSGTMQANGFFIKANNSAYRLYSRSDYAMTKGVLEAVVNPPSGWSNANRGLARLRLGNSTSALFIWMYLSSNGQGHIRLYDNSTIGSGTSLARFYYDNDYTLRLEIDNGIGAVYRNGTLLRDDIDLSTLLSPGSPQFGVHGAGGAGTIWKSVKFKREA